MLSAALMLGGGAAVSQTDAPGAAYQHVVCIAHRGNSHQAPENTLVAYREAAEIGADLAECDVDITADGHVVLMHDRSVDRTTDGSGLVQELTLEQLKALDAGSWKAEAYAGETVPTLHELMSQHTDDGLQIVVEIKAAGIAEKDIQTSGISVSPQYRYAENQPPTITGYQASNTVSIKVRDIARLGEVLDALVASGANQVNGPSFEIDRPEAVYDEARRDALELARARAEMYAKSLGMRVRRIVSISEGGGFQPPVPMMKTMAMDARMESAPVAPGETTLSANLDVVFELGN